MSSILLFLSLFSLSYSSDVNMLEAPIDMMKEERYRCTSIGVGRGATVDGSTITTHNNDCQECDIRITHVPARDWPKGSKRPIFGERVAYPRYSFDQKSSHFYRFCTLVLLFINLDI